MRQAEILNCSLSRLPSMTKPLPVALLLALVCKSALALLEITADQFASTIPSRFIVEYHHPGILPRDTSVRCNNWCRIMINWNLNIRFTIMFLDP
jgi:hypothetical protein